MNERIQKLMGKALDSEMRRTWDTMTYGDLLQFSEKFAELIVRECVEVVGDCSDQFATRSQITEEIKQHFGVEE